MKLPRLALENYRFTVIMIGLLVVFGFLSLMTMPRSEDPLVTPPGTNVIVVYPGANPEDLEQLVVDPIEEAINELDDIKILSASMRDGLAVVTVEFEAGSDADEKYSDVVQEVNAIRDDLPNEVLELRIEQFSVTDVHIMQIAFVSETATYRQLEDEADLLKDELETVPGVKRVDIVAYPEQEVRVSIDLARAAERGISLTQIENAIRATNTNIPGGHVDIGSRRFTIQTSGTYDNLADLKKTVVRAGEAEVVYLDDVADIDFDYADRAHYARVNGERAIFVVVRQKERTNIMAISNELHNRLEAFAPTLPSSIDMRMVFDQSESVNRRVNGFFGNLLQGLLLVGLVVFLAATVRAALVVMLAIPISLAIGIGWLDFSGFGLQQISIAGLVIALGLLVDNAIVVTENIQAFMRKGMKPIEAAVAGTKQVAWAITSATITTVFAFFPIIFMPDLTGDFVRSMPMMVVYALLASLIVSIVLTPFLSSRLIRPGKDTEPRRMRAVLERQVSGPYTKTLNFALRRPFVVLGIASLIFLGSLTLVPVVGISFFPKAEKPQMIVNIDAPDGTSLDATDSLATHVESVLATYPVIKTYAVNVGKGNPRIYYNVFPKNETPNHAQIFIELNSTDGRVFDETLASLRADLDGIPGARIVVKEFEQGPPVEAPIAIRVVGDNLDSLRNISRNVERFFSETPGVINIDNPLATAKSDLHVAIHREKAAILGVPLVEIDRTVRAAVAGSPVSSYRDDDGDEYDIVVRLPIENKTTLTDFDRISVASMTGGMVPLRQLASIEFETGPQRISHVDLKRTSMITADVSGARSVTDATLDIVAKLDQYEWPKGYSYQIAGELESQQESTGNLGQATIGAILAIFAILVLQFGSFKQPLVVFAAIPLAIIGSILALLITGYSFSFMALVGVSSLVGIVINNSIILVDYTNLLRREQGMSVVDALRTAGQARFIPIVLTTLTTVGGLLPLTLGGGTLWGPMGWAIIGGLLMSTFLTLLIVPVLYSLVERDSKPAVT